jgi:hypothetical protein
MIENLEAMDVGQRLDLPPHVTLTSLWPRPAYPLKDDYLTEMQRAERWLKHFGCVVVEVLDPPGLRIAKEGMPIPEFSGFRPGPPRLDERSREDVLSYLRDRT